MANIFRNYVTSAPENFDPDRQRMIAKSLRQQSAAPLQGRMVSGRYVPPSFTEGLNKLFQGYQSNKLSTQADSIEAQRREQLANALKSPEQIPEGIRDPNYQQPNLADRLGSLSNNPQAMDLATQLRLREATSQPKETYRTLSPEESQQMGLGEGLWQVSPSGQISQAYKPERQDMNKMIITGQDGQPMVNPMYIDARKQIASAGAPSTNVRVTNDNQKYGSIPAGYMLNEGPDGAVMVPVPGSPAAQDIAEKEKKEKDRLKQASLYADIVTTDIDRALHIVDNSTIPVTGMGSYLSVIRGSNAQNLKSLLDTVKANSGFDKLQKMRDASPTGGALGQVSDMENKLLQATIGSLEQAQGKDQFVYNLKRVKDVYNKIINEGISAEEGDQILKSNKHIPQSVPEGVDPDVWEYMTDEEKALFQ